MFTMFSRSGEARNVNNKGDKNNRPIRNDVMKPVMRHIIKVQSELALSSMLEEADGPRATRRRIVGKTNVGARL